MSISPGRFSQLRWLQNLVCLAAIIGSIVLIVLGVVGYAPSGSVTSTWMIALGGFVLFIAIMLMTFTPLVLKIESSLARQLDELRDLSEAQRRQTDALARISENTRISDAAKALAHRDQELDALHGAIRDDIRNEKWEPALNLIDEMERRFGHKDESDRIREEVEEARDVAIETKLQEAIEMIESHFQSRQWERAQSEIDRLAHALPDHTSVSALQGRMKVLQGQHKQELKLAWDEAVRRNDTDHAIDILKELDQYLSSGEAQELQASARNVFKDKLLQVGVQFRFAVNEKRWHDALTIGLDLVREFPNARMATEVREVLDTLRERARAGAEGKAAQV